MNAKEMVKAMRVGLEPIRKVEIGALEDVLCIRFPEKSGVWVKSSGGMPFVRPEKSLHSFCGGGREAPQAPAPLPRL